MSIYEIVSRRYFLIDSGADESVYPATQADRILPRSSDLIAANGTAIRTYGRRRLPISFSDGHHLTQLFWIADVSRPLLGADFFKDQGLLIDFRHCRLTCQINPGTHYAAVFSRSPGFAGLRGVRMPTEGPFEGILEEFPALLSQDFRGEVKHNIRH